jgi:hypothetical protein
VIGTVLRILEDRMQATRIGTPATTPIICSATMGQVRLRAGDETLIPRYNTGVRLRGLAGRQPTISFRQYLTIEDAEPDALAFLRRHPVCDVDFTLDLTDYGACDRSCTIVGCVLDDVELVEDDGDATYLVYRLSGERIEGNVLGAAK